MRKPEGEAEYAPNGGGNRGGDRGVMGGEEKPAPDPSLGAKPPRAFPESVDNAPFARRKSLRFEIARFVWGVRPQEQRGFLCDMRAF